MKKAIFVIAFAALLCFSLSAQDWLLGGDFGLSLGKDSASLGGNEISESYTLFALDAYFGRYINPNFAVGGELGFTYYGTTGKLTGSPDVTYNENVFKIGPMIQYDFLRGQFLSLGLFSSLTYNSYSGKDWGYSPNSIDLNAALQLNLQLNKTVEVFMTLADAGFQYFWFSYSGVDYSTTTFRVNSILNSVMGLASINFIGSATTTGFVPITGTLPTVTKIGIKFKF